MNRGIAKRTVFERREDVRYFLSLLARASRRGAIELHAYSILTTHFHLLVRSPRAQLSRAIGWVEQCFVQRFNRRRGRDGPLFRGRFHSRAVETSRYWHVLVQYIDANPVAAGLADRAVEYAWGSRRHYLSSRGPRWLHRERVEAAVMRRTRSPSYDPADYDAVFPCTVSSGATWVVERRLDQPDAPDPSEVDLIRQAPKRVLRGLAVRARLADGLPVGVPVASPDDVSKALRALGGDAFFVRSSRKRVQGTAVLHVGLLRSVACLTNAEIGIRTGLQFPTIKRYVTLHRQALHDDPRYRETCAAATKHAVAACLTRESYRNEAGARTNVFGAWSA